MYLNRVPKELRDRWHECSCGASMPRDLNSGILIKKVGLGVRLTIKRFLREVSEEKPTLYLVEVSVGSTSPRIWV
jgi:putative transposase